MVEDLIAMQLIPTSSRESVLGFLTSLRQHAKEFRSRSARHKALFGGGYHLVSCEVFTDVRIAFDKVDIVDVSWLRLNWASADLYLWLR